MSASSRGGILDLLALIGLIFRGAVSIHLISECQSYLCHGSIEFYDGGCGGGARAGVGGGGVEECGKSTTAK